MKLSSYCVAILLLATEALAATLPAGFTETRITNTLASPTAMTFAPDGRLFICEQGGNVRIVSNGTLLATPFLTVTVDSQGERGLLGIAFDPNFATNNYVYIYYTATTPTIHNRISRFTANGNVVVPGSETAILDLETLSAAVNHNGGAIHFGPDGKLYVAVGENGQASNSQTLANRLGKMLRINSDGTIPTDNPFYNTASGANRSIWALGLRNPFTFAFQPGTGRMFINDVGGSQFEEVNDGIAGSNYGWPTTEGYTTNPNFRSPVYAYARTAGLCAIVGAAFYNPAVSRFPATYAGKYFFADLCAGWIRTLDPSTYAVGDFATGIPQPVDIATADDGTLWYVTHPYFGAASLYRIDYTGSGAPTIVTHPQSVTVTAGQTATFSVTANGTGPLTYRWQRNQFDISGATSSSYSLPNTTMADNGAQFRVIVSNADGSVTSNSATLTVTSNTAPTATISTPVAGSMFSGGDTISFSGTGTDAEDGNLPATAFTWQIDLHHDAHAHPAMAPTSGITSGTFVVPTSGETSANVWYRITLTVRDSGGLTHTVTRDVMPRTAQITLTTVPAGLQVTLDGEPVTSPYSVLGVTGITRVVGAVSPQTVGGTTYVFGSWSDGGASQHSIVTPATNTTYTVTYQLPSRGDANGDGSVGAPDIFYLINHLFTSGPAPVGSGDINGDGTVSAPDIFYLINYLFTGGPPPPP